MKCFNANKYKYIGVKDGYHCFATKVYDSDNQEIVMIKQAYLIHRDGSRQYFHKI